MDLIFIFYLYLLLLPKIGIFLNVDTRKKMMDLNDEVICLYLFKYMKRIETNFI